MGLLDAQGHAEGLPPRDFVTEDEEQEILMGHLLLARQREALRNVSRTLTVLTLGLSERLRQSLATTNAIESLISRTRHVKRNVKRWRGGQMVLRWTAAAVLEAVKGFRRLKGHKDMPKLVAALRARDQQLGIAVSVENVA